jgi:hypothetical protein
VTLLRTLKNLTPLSARRFLKHRLPTALVAAVATSAQPGKMETGGPKLAKRSSSPRRFECPICGTELQPQEARQQIECAGCGSRPHHRCLSLAIYAAMNGPGPDILVLGSDSVTKTIFAGVSNVAFAEDLDAVRREAPSGIDLCIHSYRLAGNSFRMGKVLKAADALLSPNGKQIFAVDAYSGALGPMRRRQQDRGIIQWLQKKGWPHCSVFEPDAFYGAGASEAFGCTAPEDADELVIVLPKARA